MIVVDYYFVGMVILQIFIWLLLLFFFLIFFFIFFFSRWIVGRKSEQREFYSLLCPKEDISNIIDIQGLFYLFVT